MPTEETWDKAGKKAALDAGFECDEPYWEPFSFTIDGFEFTAEITELHGPGIGLIEVKHGGKTVVFDESGDEE